MLPIYLSALALCLPQPATVGELPTTYAATIEDLAGPVDCAWDQSGDLIILERDAHRLRRLTPGGSSLETVALHGERGSGPGQLLFPQGLGLGPDGSIWVADTGNRRVVQFSPAGVFMGAINGSDEAGGHFLRPVDVAVRGGRVAVADAGAHGVFRFECEPDVAPGATSTPGATRTTGATDATPAAHNLRSLSMLGGHGSGEHDLLSPSGMAFDSIGDLVISDTENHRLLVFDRHGALLRDWGDWGWFPGLFSTPLGIAVLPGRGAGGPDAPEGNLLFVADQENHRIQVFNGAGEQRHRFGLHALKPGQGAGHLHYPCAVAIASDGARLAICEPLDDRVQLFRRARPGDAPPPKISDWQANSASAHFGTHLAAGGNLLAVVEPETHSILIYEDSWREPRKVTTIGGFGAPWGQFRRPGGLDWNPATRTLVVADRGNLRLQLFRLGSVDEEEPAYDARLARFVTGLDLSNFNRQRDESPNSAQPRLLEAGPLTWDEQDRLVMLDPLTANLFCFDEQMTIHYARETTLGAPRDLAMAGDGQTVLITDAALPGVAAISPTGQQTLLIDGAAGLIEPHGICVDEKGRIFVVDAAAHAIFRFQADGTPDGRWGGRGLGRMEFNRPRGITLAGGDRLVINDHGNHRLMTVSTDGEYLGIFGPRLYTHAARYPGITPANGAQR
ncbi:MAG: NHL repeat-containing protein [Planctomycetota bacterium]|nr:NHL repeat-containing protein [Planctomycetota bacterium]